MDIDDDFIPDFTLEAITGLISTRNTKLIQKDEFSFISIHNRINVWNYKTQEHILTLGTNSHGISSFIVTDSHLIIGYETGLLEIISEDFSTKSLQNHPDFSQKDTQTIRLHKKRVTNIVSIPNGFISTSSDGAIVQYDFLLESVFSYKDNNVSAEKVKVAGQAIFVVCADKTIKSWEMDSKNLKDAFAFDDYVFDCAVCGNELLVIQKNGESFFIDLSTKARKNFESFRMIRSMVHKDNKLVIHMRNKVITYRITKDKSFGLVSTDRLSVDDVYTQVELMNGRLIFLTKHNSIEMLGETETQIVHSNEILQMKVVENCVYSLSKEKLIIWEVTTRNKYKDVNGSAGCNNGDEQYDISEFDHKSLDITGWILLDKSTCFEIFSQYLIVGSSNGLNVYSRSSFEFVKNILTDKVISIAMYNDILAVATDKVVTFYNNEFVEVFTQNSPESLIFISFSPLGDLFCTSTYDNKINVFNFPNLSLKISLYGHSLPVRSFSISPDNKLLLSAGSDKLVKLWGIEFGDCKKSYIGDCKNVEFINSSLFMFADKEIRYYNGRNELKSFQCYDPGILKMGDDFFVVTADKGVGLFTANRYEFMAEENEEIEHPMMKDVADTDKYDEFVNYIDRLEKDNSVEEIERFYKFIGNLGMVELNEYIYILDGISIDILMNMIESKLDRNIVLNSRLFINLFRFHKAAIISHKFYSKIRICLVEKCKDLRELIGTNEARTEIENNYEELNYEI